MADAPQTTPVPPHTPRICNGQWVCAWCDRVLRPLRKQTACQGARKLLAEIENAAA